VFLTGDLSSHHAQDTQQAHQLYPAYQSWWRGYGGQQRINRPGHDWNGAATVPGTGVSRWLRVHRGRRGAPMPCGYGGQVPPSVVNSTKMTVVTARMPWATTTGTGKLRSGGALCFLVGDEPG
jgi:hypothetical protein